jgi:2-C-methyl-D-erythritol 4-phosphate cytidylyltransferase/2-C-methyl-D-erythritol 2,4-cyclodiphosphate synthase
MASLHVTAIIAAGGRGARLGATQPKQLLPLGGVPILQRSIAAFLRSPRVADLVVALPVEVASRPPQYLAHPRVRVVVGGARRQDSVAGAFAVAPAADILIIHDAARPLVSEALITRTLEAAIEYGAAIAAVPASDTVKRAATNRWISDTLPREEIYLAQTPQAFRAAVLRDALALGTAAEEATDEALLAERAGHRVRIVDGEARNIKITSAEDLRMAEALVGAATAVRIGHGYDLHRLVAGRPLVLGGVTIPFEKGLEGHSDADAVCHAVTDAILGAAACGDIGRHFPDTDAAGRGANSVELLRSAAAVVRNAGFSVGNVDVTVVAERPKLVGYVERMGANIASALGIDAAQVSVKGKTNEGVDAAGRGDAIAVHAVALLLGAGTAHGGHEAIAGPGAPDFPAVVQK